MILITNLLRYSHSIIIKVNNARKIIMIYLNCCVIIQRTARLGGLRVADVGLVCQPGWAVQQKAV